MALSRDEIFITITVVIHGITTIGLEDKDVTLATRVDDLDSLQQIDLREGLEDAFTTRYSMRRMMRTKTVGEIVSYLGKRNASLRDEASVLQ